MNIRKDSAGYVTEKHIIESGFKVDKENSFSDMGQMTVTLKDYSKNGQLFLTGGYWTYYIKDGGGKVLWEGWWNSNEEFDKTINEIEQKMA